MSSGRSHAALVTQGISAGGDPKFSAGKQQEGLAAAESAYPLCAQFGIDCTEISRRLLMFGFGEEDDRNLAVARRIIESNLEILTDGFYGHLLRFPEAGRLVGGSLDQLRTSLKGYLQTLGKDLTEPDYFEGRLRVGLVHERFGIAPKWYISAYATLRALLNRLLLEEPTLDPEERSRVLVSVNKAICLDIELAIETYHQSAVGRIERLMQQLKDEQDRIRRLARTDQLTGLSNRRDFLEKVESEVHRSQRYGSPLCLMIVDIDDFKSINDTCGHATGDAVLRAFGHALPGLTRSTDCVGRLGGEEFAVMLVESDQSTGELIAERIRLGLLQHEFEAEADRFSVSVSIGLAACNETVPDTTALLRQADRALYQAKHDGKNCLRVCGESTMTPDPVPAHSD